MAVGITRSVRDLAIRAPARTKYRDLVLAVREMRRRWPGRACIANTAAADLRLALKVLHAHSELAPVQTSS